MPKTQPWHPADPYWEMLPEPECTDERYSYEERAAIMEYHGGMSQGLAEQAAYSFVFADRPGTLPAFMDEDEVQRQVNRAGIIRRDNVHREKILNKRIP